MVPNYETSPCCCSKAQQTSPVFKLHNDAVGRQKKTFHMFCEIYKNIDTIVLDYINLHINNLEHIPHAHILGWIARDFAVS